MYYYSDSDDEDDERRREHRFIKLFAPQERTQTASKKGLFPRKDFKSQIKALRSGTRLDFPEYTIWERLPWTAERQGYLDQWIKDYEDLKTDYENAGLYKALPCRSTSKYGHLEDTCHRYHSNEDMDHEAVAALKAAEAAKAAAAAAKVAALKAEEEEKQRLAVEQRRLANEAFYAEQMERQRVVDELVDAVDAACRKRTKPRERRPGPNDPVEWF